jgi:hypothetical protein
MGCDCGVVVGVGGHSGDMAACRTGQREGEGEHMSRLLQCDRCAGTMEIGEDDEHNPTLQEWSELVDTWDNTRCPYHLCSECRGAFEEFMKSAAQKVSI